MALPLRRLRGRRRDGGTRPPGRRGGHGHRVDLAPEKLAIARREADTQGLGTIERRAADLFDLDPGGEVDLVYTRFVLSQLADPAAAFARMSALLREGGRLVVEDAEASANFRDPPDPAFDLYNRLYQGGTPAEVSAASERPHAMAKRDDAFMSMPRIVRSGAGKGAVRPTDRTVPNGTEMRMTGSDIPLVGTWVLQSWRNETEDGRSLYPLGQDATGHICYSPDGYVFVQMSAGARAPYAGSDPFGGSAEEDSAALKSQIAYSGSYSLRGDHVVHHVTQATFPNWVGTEQRRKVRLSGDALRLSAAGVLFQGHLVTAIVDWRRAAPHPAGAAR